MKTYLLAAVSAILIPCCNHKEVANAADAAATAAAQAEAKRLDAVNARLKESLRKERERASLLESELSATRAQLDDLVTKANTMVLANKALDTARERLADARDQQAAQAAAAVPEKMTDEQKLAADDSSGISGVETQAGREIIRKAKLEGNAWRSVYEIESEAAGWLAVQAFSTTTTAMPHGVRDAIVVSAKREHPGDWSAMADEIREEAEAWTTLDEWKRTNVPGLNRAASNTVIAAAQARYPADWSMALFVIDSEAKKLLSK